MERQSMKVRRMSRLRQLPPWIISFMIVVTPLLAFRISASVDAGLPGAVALRTYLFWAMVCAPIAYLADLLGRTVLEYRVVRLVVARVRSRR